MTEAQELSLGYFVAALGAFGVAVSYIHTSIKYSDEGFLVGSFYIALGLFILAILYGVLGHVPPSIEPVLSIFLIMSGVFISVLFFYAKLRGEQAPAPPAPVLETPVFEIPLHKRFEHTLILGGTGSGKTTLMTDLIIKDTQNFCSIVVFDSKGTMNDKILRMQIPRDRIVIIDPTDEHPVSLSLFDFPTLGVTQSEKEVQTNRVIELLSVVLGALDAETTTKQELPLRFLIRLCLTIPNATLLTLRDLLIKDEFLRFTQYINRLPETARLFFQHQFLSKDFASTREQLQRRVYTILEDTTLERMFSRPISKFKMDTALDEGKIILVNTAKGKLGEARSAFFSRFMFALCLQAIQKRDLAQQNTPAFLYIDEASPIIDKNIATALETLREYRAGVTLAFQSLSQIPHTFEQSIITNTSTKYLNQISGKDARALAEDVGSHHETLMRYPPHNFFCHIKGFGQSEVTVDASLYKRLPKRTDLRQLVEENREKYCITEYEREPTIVRAVADGGPSDDIEDLNSA